MNAEVDTEAAAGRRTRAAAAPITRGWHRRLMRTADALGARLPRRPAPAIASEEVGRLLLIRRGSFGDVILMGPAIARARTLFPQAHMTWMIDPAYANFAAQAGFVDALWPVAGWMEAWRARPAGFDWALDFHADPRHLLLGRRHGRRLAGYGIRGGGFWLGCAPAYPAEAPAAVRHARLVEAAAGAEKAPLTELARPQLRLMPAWEQRAALWLRRWPRPFIVVHPGCGQPSKRWPWARWRALLEHCRRRGYVVALAGGARDRALYGGLARAAAVVGDISGETDWGGLAGIVAEAAAVVAPDTGIIHLAQALGTPALALFGPNDPAVWGYSGTRQRCLAHRLGCSYCARGRCPLAPAGAISPCMQAIAVDEAARALDELMQPHRAVASA